MWIINLLHWYIVSCVWNLAMVSNLLQDVEVSLEQMIPCPDSVGNSIMTYKDVVITRLEQDSYVFNANLNVLEEIKDNFELLYILVKCTSKANPASCEHFAQKKIDHVCDHIEGTSVGKTLKRAGVKPECPISAGEYKLEQVPFNMSAEVKTFLSIAEYYKLDIIAKSPDRELMCSHIEFGISPKTSKAKKKNYFFESN